MSNQLLIQSPNLLTPRKGTFHEALTKDPIDLSSVIYDKKSFTRKILLGCLSNFIESNKDITSYFFTKQGTRASVFLVRQDRTISSVGFNLLPTSEFDGNDWKKKSLRSYLILMLDQNVWEYKVDYRRAQNFVYS